MEIPDELYRQVKAKSALEGRSVREVAVELFRRYVGWSEAEVHPPESEEPAAVDGVPVPEWFGRFRRASNEVERHDLDAIRESIGRRLRKKLRV